MMQRVRSGRQRGATLLAMLAIIAVGASWFLVSKLNADSSGIAAVRKSRNVEVLNRAKQALIGYVAMQAIQSTEKDPGRLPCPEALGSFDSSTTEGIAAGNCTLPTVGRLPWRTLGLDKLVDAAGEPLWYVVSPGWALLPPGTPATLNINSNTVGQLTVDGVSNDSVALIIAPGPAFSAPATTGCAAWTQVRSATGTPDWRNYLECENATSPADLTFVTTRSPIVDSITKLVTPVLNDQLIRVTAADIVPAIEAAIAARIEREILPALKTVYTPAAWGFLGSNPVLPFAAPWPTTTYGPGPGTTGSPSSDYKGATATYQGLLPFNQTQGCTTNAADPRCTTATTGPTALLVFSKSSLDQKIAGSGGINTQSTCSWQSNVYVCTGMYDKPSISVRFTLKVTNVAMGLRTLDTSKVTCTAVDDVGNGDPIKSVACSVTSIALQTDGSAILTVDTSALPDVASSGWGNFANYTFNFDQAVFGDHPLLGLNARYLRFNSGIAEIFYGQTVTGVTSGASGTAVVLKQSGSWGSDAAGLLFFSSVTNGPFRSGEVLRVGGAPKATAAADESDLGWFVRNEWYRLIYYAVSPSNTSAKVAATERSCSATPADCLTLATNVTPLTISALLILAGRSINGSTRPSGTLTNYLEFGNAKPTPTFERRTATPAPAAIYIDTGTANTYVIPATSLAAGTVLQFRAKFSNTGTSTLNTSATGAKSLVNSDGSNLTASTILANAVVQVVYDGSKFLLSKRPFNDRVVASSSN